MKKSVYSKPELHILQFDIADVLSISGSLPGIDNGDNIGQPVPPITDGGTYN